MNREVENNISQFFALAAKREELRKMRLGNRPREQWTDDPLFKAWKFPNVRREDDKTTVWIRENVREPLKESQRVLTAMTICRLFNRLDTLMILNSAGLLEDWDPRAAMEVLGGREQIMGDAYVVATPKGMTKLEGVCWIVGQQQRINQTLVQVRVSTMEELWFSLQRIPFIKSMLAYEIVSDLRHTYLLKNAKDIMTWAYASPAVCFGLEQMFQTPLKFGSKATNDKALELMQNLLERSRHPFNWSRHRPRWEMREVSRWCQQYSRYRRLQMLGHLPTNQRFVLNKTYGGK